MFQSSQSEGSAERDVRAERRDNIVSDHLFFNLLTLVFDSLNRTLGFAVGQLSRTKSSSYSCYLLDELSRRGSRLRGPLALTVNLLAFVFLFGAVGLKVTLDIPAEFRGFWVVLVHLTSPAQGEVTRLSIIQSSQLQFQTSLLVILVCEFCVSVSKKYPSVLQLGMILESAPLTKTLSTPGGSIPGSSYTTVIRFLSESKSITFRILISHLLRGVDAEPELPCHLFMLFMFDIVVLPLS